MNTRISRIRLSCLHYSWQTVLYSRQQGIQHNSPVPYNWGMWRFIRLMIACVVLFTALASGVVLIGHQQPQLTFIPELQRCGDSFCYLSILPGTTPWIEGWVILRHTRQISSAAVNNPNLFVHSDPYYVIEFLPARTADSATSFVFGETNLSVGNLGLSAGNLISIFGPPCYVTSDTVGVFLGYPNAVFTVSSITYSLTPTSSITHAVLRRPVSQPCPTADTRDVVIVYEWRGFRTYH